MEIASVDTRATRLKMLRTMRIRTIGLRAIYGRAPAGIQIKGGAEPPGRTA
jgi:hypothetical protein